MVLGRKGHAKLAFQLMRLLFDHARCDSRISFRSGGEQDVGQEECSFYLSREAAQGTGVIKLSEMLPGLTSATGLSPWNMKSIIRPRQTFIWT